MTATMEHAAVSEPVRGASAQLGLSYFFFTLSASLYLLPFMRILLQGTDEGTLVYGAVRVSRGQVFARDFFEVVGPGTFYWLAIFFKVFGTTFVATRICLFLTSLGTALLMYFLSRRVCRKYQTLPCILLASVYLGMLWPTISHHVDSNFFALLSVACVVLWQNRRRDSLLLAAGLFAGATTCFHPPKGILLLLSLLLWLWIQRRRGSATLSSLVLVMGSYCSAIGIVFVYFGSRGALRALIYVTFVWPSGHYGAVNAVPYAKSLIRNYWDHWAGTQSGWNWRVAAAGFLITPLLFVAALPGLLPVLGIWHRKSKSSPEVVLYWLCGWALWLSEFHRKDIYHLIFGSPLLMIVCVYILSERQEKVANFVLQMLSICAACLAAFNLFLVLAAHPFMTRVGSVALFRDEPVLSFLDLHIAPGQEIFAYPYCPMYYFLSSATNPTRYSFLMYNYNTTSQFQEVIRALDERHVRYVIWNPTFADEAVSTFFPAVQSEHANDLIIEPYLETHYELVWADAGIRFMERKSEDRADRR